MTVEITEVASNTYLLNCGKDRLGMAYQTAYLLVDDHPVLIDPGATIAVADLLSYSSQLGLERLAYIIPTHIHLDHGGGTGSLLQHIPKAMVVLHPKGAIHLKEPSRLLQGARNLYGDNCEELFGPCLPVPADRIHVARDGEDIPLGKRTLRVFFTPGHATHHISMLDSLTGGLFCGEALGFTPFGMPDVICPAAAPPFDPDLYVQSIDRLSSLHPRILFCAHMGVRKDVDHVIREVRANSLAFGDLIRRALQDGETEDRMWERLTAYVRERWPRSEVRDAFRLILSGYVEYFRNKARKAEK
ncbi:MAG: MBL fold metallo-hydrolase [Chloroflexi bacterium]|nr:MBL fold metallo-hydrolase [Chloroflexota bacterium]